MKKICFLIGTLAAVLIANAQKVNPGGIYLRGGYNLSNISTKSNGGVDDARALSTFNVGATADIPLLPVLSLQTGLLLSGKGSKSDSYLDANDHSDNYVKTKFNPLYLELPVNLLVKFPIDESIRVFVGGGPYVAMGIGGKAKGESSLLGVKDSYSESIKFNNDDPLTGEQEGARFDRLKRFDVGLNAVAGLEVSRMMFALNYGWGLTKINSTQTNNSANDKNKFRTFSVNVGVRI